MPTMAPTRESQILSGKNIADNILEEVALQVREIKERHHLSPFLMAIQVGFDPATQVYLQSQQKMLQKAGINYNVIELSQDISTRQLLEIIKRVNNDPVVNGVIVHHPLPEHIDAKKIQWGINPRKDVEGVTPHNLGRLFLGAGGLYPCTALSILALIKATGVDLKGKEVTIVGHSSIVGKPTAMLLLNEEATVTICHYATSERGMLEYHVRNAEILVVAVGIPNLIPGAWIKDGAIVIDAGINRSGGSIVGDVDFPGALKRAGYITPVPGGVGKVTTAYLVKNTLQAFKAVIK